MFHLKWIKCGLWLSFSGRAEHNFFFIDLSFKTIDINENNDGQNKWNTIDVDYMQKRTQREEKI